MTDSVVSNSLLKLLNNQNMKVRFYPHRRAVGCFNLMPTFQTIRAVNYVGLNAFTRGCCSLVGLEAFDDHSSWTYFRNQLATRLLLLKYTQILIDWFDFSTVYWKT